MRAAFSWSLDGVSEMKKRNELLSKGKKTRLLPYAVLFILASIFVWNFSYSTSPLTPFYWGGDTAQFLTIGKEWYFGKVPYRDLFDHKGPLIFFVDMLGFAMTNGRSTTGVFLLQIIFMTFSLWAFYNIGLMFLKRADFGVVVSFITLICIKANYIEGNTVEEYCIPFIAWSIYGLLTWLTDNDIEYHDSKWAFLYGVTFAVCFLTRLTNAIPFIPGMCIVFFALLLKKQYKNIFENIVAFFIGFLVLTVPFSLYFAWKGCFFEFLDGTLFYNIKYANARKSWILTATSEDIISFLKNFFLSWSIFIAGILAAIRKKYLRCAFYLLTGILEIIFFLSGDNFGQYAYVCIPQICCLIGEITLAIKGDEVETLTAFISAQILCYFMIFVASKSMSGGIEIHGAYAERWDRGWDSLIEEIPEEERDQFVAYGDNRFKELYLLNNISPCYKYFVIQEWHASMSEKTREDIHSVFDTCRAKWIAVCGEVSVIEDVLENHYDLVDSNGDYLLYKLSPD